jgi:mono/diheme cytochrome c family protein
MARSGGEDMRALVRLAAIAVLVALSGAAVGAQPALRGDAQAGARLADRVCSACHIVARHQALAPLIVHSAPSFFAIARRRRTTAASLETFLAHPHALARMPFPHLTQPQIADVTAYILSLRRRR